jgi:hypothetical protein
MSNSDDSLYLFRVPSLSTCEFLWMFKLHVDWFSTVLFTSPFESCWGCTGSFLEKKIEYLTDTTIAKIDNLKDTMTSPDFKLLETKLNKVTSEIEKIILYIDIIVSTILFCTLIL